LSDSKLERHKVCAFAVYYDVPTSRVILHKIGVHLLEIHGGDHIPADKGGWGYFVTEEEAQSFADAISNVNNFPKPQYCKICYDD